MWTEQKQNAVPCEYSIRVITEKPQFFAFDCGCHTSTHPPHTSPVSLKTVVLPVLHAAGVMFHFHKFIHVFQKRDAKQWF